MAKAGPSRVIIKELSSNNAPEVLSNDDEISNEEDQCDNSFNAMMNNILPDKDTQGDNFEGNADILEALADVEQEVEYGPDITAYVAEAFNKTGVREISKENQEKIKQIVKLPANCKYFTVPKMNPEIWQNLPKEVKMRDLKTQQTQHSLSTGLSVLAIIGNKLASRATELPPDLVKEVLKLAMDGANILGTQLQELNKKRRQDVKPSVSHDYRGICSAKISSYELLFGTNLSETLKSTKNTSTIIRKSTMGGSLQGQRYQPYPRPSGSGLNLQRPFLSTRGRWNGRGQYLQRTSPFQSRPNLNRMGTSPTGFKRFQNFRN